MPDLITADEYLTVNNVPLATPAWRITSLVPLFSGPRVRGEDVKIPGIAGVLGQPRRYDLTVLTFPLVVFGSHDREGDPYSDKREGLTANIETLLAAFAPVSTGDGTVVATWHQADAGTLSANVHVIGFDARAFSPGAVRYQLSLSIPAGRFA